MPVRALRGSIRDFTADNALRDTIGASRGRFLHIRHPGKAEGWHGAAPFFLLRCVHHGLRPRYSIWIEARRGKSGRAHISTASPSPVSPRRQLTTCRLSSEAALPVRSRTFNAFSTSAGRASGETPVAVSAQLTVGPSAGPVK